MKHSHFLGLLSGFSTIDFWTYFGLVLIEVEWLWMWSGQFSDYKQIECYLNPELCVRQLPGLEKRTIGCKIVNWGPTQKKIGFEYKKATECDTKLHHLLFSTNAFRDFRELNPVVYLYLLGPSHCSFILLPQWEDEGESWAPATEFTAL